MRKSIQRFALVLSAVALIVLSSCKGNKDADIQKAVSEKISAATDVTGAAATVKDGVVTLTGEFKDAAAKDAFETAVKAIPDVKSVVNNSTVAPAPAPPAPAPVAINGDDALKTGVTDAIKDFPGVKAEVKDSVITLTGDIKRASLQKLMMGLHTLKAKKIENKLTIK
ncbi:MAG: BON domain-containing protein [Chitinophagaceae bacterium]